MSHRTDRTMSNIERFACRLSTVLREIDQQWPPETYQKPTKDCITHDWDQRNRRCYRCGITERDYLASFGPRE